MKILMVDDSDASRNILQDILESFSFAEELKSEFDAVAPICDELIRLAEDFDFEGIQRCVDEFNN